MKNLVFAIEALARVRHPVELDIYGPVDDETHAAACRRAAASAADRLTVRWHGHVPHEEVRGIFSRHDLFLFPTRGENFGHVIFESLAAGTPVLVSDRTPWQDLDAAGVGWVRSLAACACPRQGRAPHLAGGRADPPAPPRHEPPPMSARTPPCAA
jgi:glycosyltransferase involved in cell wall biosynthesis